MEFLTGYIHWISRGTGSMPTQAPEDFVSEQEYWASEEASPIKHEYFQGRIYAMEAGSYNHTTIIGNIAAATKNALHSRTHRSRSSTQRIKVETNGLLTYSDGVIFPLLSRFEGSGNHTLLTPKVIFEVFSDSTERYDRGDKFRSYAQIESLTDYVLIDQNRVTVEHFRRTPEGWLLNMYVRRTDSLSLQSIEIELTLDSIYDELDLPDAVPAILQDHPEVP
ncbi:Uma2 family endonuclease [bacterium]|nr:MAG: Uma2 family endonuclease [bacterium]